MTKEQIVEANSKLIWYLTNQFYGVDKEDLYQTGVNAVLKAYENYKPEEGAKFSTFAYKAIWGAMYKLANNRTLKVSRDIIRLKKMIEQAREIITQKNGKEATNAEIAAFLEKDIKDIEMVLASFNNLVSFDEDNSEERSLYETIPAKEVNIDDKILVQDCLSTLSDFEKQIINLRYFQDFTQEETAKALGVNQVKVSRYEKRSLVKMQDYLK